jgi:xenotropic and polytropic retrovirus receptor 1
MICAQRLLTQCFNSDQFCSMVFVFSNLYFFGCVYAEGFTEDWQDCGLQTSNWAVVFILAILPFLVRSIQSIRRYLDSGLATHLINVSCQFLFCIQCSIALQAGKYAAGIVSFLMYFMWRHSGMFSSCFDLPKLKLLLCAGTEREGAFFIFYCLTTTFYSSYSLTWVWLPLSLVLLTADAMFSI